jgi:hypothetical protein
MPPPWLSATPDAVLPLMVERTTWICAGGGPPEFSMTPVLRPPPAPVRLLPEIVESVTVTTGWSAGASWSNSTCTPPP